MERAGVAGLVAALVAAQHGAAVCARIDESIQLALFVARDDDRLTAHRRGEIIVGVGDLALVGQIDPVALENVLHLKFEQRGIGKDVAGYLKRACRGILPQDCVERVLNGVGHSRSPRAGFLIGTGFGGSCPPSAVLSHLLRTTVQD